jgi:excisionase family DNA binding protein
MNGPTRNDEEAPETDRRNAARQNIRPGGRRELTLTLDEVADVLRCDVRTVRKLIRTQALCAIRISPRVTRITERALGEYLGYPPSNSNNGR